MWAACGGEGGSEAQWERLLLSAGVGSGGERDAQAVGAAPSAPTAPVPCSHSEGRGRPIRVLCMGEALLTFKHVPSALAHGQTASACLAAVGGSELNVAVALSHLGVRSSWASVLPAHELGDDVLKVAQHAGVDTAHVLRRHGDIGTLHVREGSKTPLYQRARSVNPLLVREAASHGAVPTNTALRPVANSHSHLPIGPEAFEPEQPSCASHLATRPLTTRASAARATTAGFC